MFSFLCSVERECSLLLFQDFSSPCRNDAFFTQPSQVTPCFVPSRSLVPIMYIVKAYFPCR